MSIVLRHYSYIERYNKYIYLQIQYWEGVVNLYKDTSIEIYYKGKKIFIINKIKRDGGRFDKI